MRTAQLVVRFTFAAAHHLPGYDGPCANVHGHTWRDFTEKGGAGKEDDDTMECPRCGGTGRVPRQGEVPSKPCDCGS